MTVKESPAASGAIRSITALLPSTWDVVEADSASQQDQRSDGTIDLVAPNGHRIPFVIEIKRSGTASTSHVVRELRDLQRRSLFPILLMSDYIGPGLRTALVENGINFADATGWVRVSTDDPLILLTGHGASKPPRPPRANAVVRLNGIAANRTIRELMSLNEPIGVRALADAAGVSPGSVSKLLPTLAAEGVVDREENGRVTAVRRRALLRRWVRDYSFPATNKPVEYFIAPRGLNRTLRSLEALTSDVALTGSAAARRLLPPSTTSVVPLRLLAVYTTDPAGLASELGLIEASPDTANVVVAAPQDRSILGRTSTEPLIIAPPPLVLADLLTLPNRSDAEAEQLMNALAYDDAAWEERP